MEITHKNLLRGIATALLIPANLLGLFWFSMFGALGGYISIFALNSKVDDDVIIPILGSIIGLIIITPITKLIWSVKKFRFLVFFRSLVWLQFYLFGGVLAIFALFFAVNLLGLFNDEKLEILGIICQFFSFAFAIGYYFYFKKVIKVRALKF